jgi:adenine-specific DNA-methyltransferase
LERDGEQGPVTVTTSTDATFTDLAIYCSPFDRIVCPDDPEQVMHIPTSPATNPIEQSDAVCHTLAELGIQVSTGPVVDFRLQSHLRAIPEPGTVPLLYPSHLSNTGVDWPVVGSRKPNAIMRNVATERLLYPNGFYCVVHRFSSKEEKRRIAASVVEPGAFCNAPVLGFENHLNVFHENRHGLPEALARGMVVFLNTTAVDEYFRRFSGHTQVNATDLKRLKYPSRDTLIELGTWAMREGPLTQEKIDAKVEALLR